MSAETKKILVNKSFEYGGEKHEPGEHVELPNAVADRVIEKGAGSEVEDLELEEEIEENDEEIDLDVETEAAQAPPKNEEEEEEESLEFSEGTEDPWKELEEALDEDQTLPEKWNAGMKRNNKTLKREPPVNPLFGTIVQKGIGNFPQGKSPYLVIEDRNDGTKYTIYPSTALKSFLYTAEEGMKAALRFEGIEKSEKGGRNFLNYSKALKRNGERIGLREPPEDEWWEDDELRKKWLK